MINFFAKSLVLVHAVLSVAAMTWAISVFLQAKDFGWIEPAREVLEYNAEGNVKSAVRLASEYDKSAAALKLAGENRDLTYIYVRPALESLRDTEPYLPNNHLYYAAELKRLRFSPDAIEVKRFQNGGLLLDVPNLGKSVPEDKALEGITKSIKMYEADDAALAREIDGVEAEIRKIVDDTKKITAQLTGTDDLNMHVHPGLYQMIDLEFKAQVGLKNEIDDIKPFRAKATEEAFVYQARRVNLEETLEKLKAPPPAKVGNNKK